MPSFFDRIANKLNDVYNDIHQPTQPAQQYQASPHQPYYYEGAHYNNGTPQAQYQAAPYNPGPQYTGQNTGYVSPPAQQQHAPVVNSDPGWAAIHRKAEEVDRLLAEQGQLPHLLEQQRAVIQEARDYQALLLRNQAMAQGTILGNQRISMQMSSAFAGMNGAGGVYYYR